MQDQIINISKNVIDMVKIKVHLDEHFYIFSRFLISRMLTLSKVKKLDAIQIAKDIKKQLIERNYLDVSSKELEILIFETMTKFKYENSIQKYQMVSNFYRKRTPMIIIIFGAPCIGKSLLANNLAERLNISNVLQTDIVAMVMRSMEQLNEDDDNDKHCRLIRRGVQTDILKCLSEGKAVIIEGLGAQPDHYLSSNGIKYGEDLIQSYISGTVKLKKSQRRDLTLFNDEENLNGQVSIIYPPPIEQIEYKMQKELELIVLILFLKNYHSQDQSKSMIIGFLPIINRSDHLYNIENNLGKKFPKEEVEQRIQKYQGMQQHLLDQRSKCIVLPINLHNLEETLDSMHDIILQKILATQ